MTVPGKTASFLNRIGILREFPVEKLEITSRDQV